MNAPPWLRRTLARAAWMILGAVVAAAAFAIFAQRNRPELETWHRWAPRPEYRAGDSIHTLAEYRARERALFDAVTRRLSSQKPRLEPFNRYRFDAAIAIQARTGGNGTFEIAVANPRGIAVLFHGLSDSPYSVQPLGRVLAAEGYHVVGIRLPGHGTVPAALLDVSWEDWRAAAELAVKDVVSRVGRDKPLVLAGYSNGTTVALDYTLRSLDDSSLPRPQKLIFLSPAFAISPSARFAPLMIALSHVPGLEKLGWVDIVPEYDPFKYNSFTVNAGAQTFGITKKVEEELTKLEAQNRLGEIPPVLTIQSVADSTVPPIPSLRRLYGRLRGAGNELVLFDVNRETSAAAMLRPDADALLRLGRNGIRIPFTITLVTNASSEMREVVAMTYLPGVPKPEVAPTGLSWPAGVYSLSHVAIPFPPDDPVYGAIPNPASPFPSLGRLELRGESRMLRAPSDLLMRLRYDPFFPYLALRVTQFAAPRTAPSTSGGTQP